MGSENFLTTLEQLTVGYELAASSSVARQRAGLMIIDSVALIALRAHALQLFASSEGSVTFSRRVFAGAERRRILADFGSLTKLGLDPLDGTPSWRMPASAPLLTAGDAAVLRIGHRYRNRLYHAGQQNSTLLQPLARLYAAAAGRAFACTQRGGVSTGPVSAEAEGRLRALGFKPPAPWFDERSKTVEWRAAADALTADMAAAAHATSETLADLLATDLEERAEAAADNMKWLADHGYGLDELERALDFGQFWDADVEGDDETDKLLKSYREATMRYYARPENNEESARDLAESTQAIQDELFARLTERRTKFKRRFHVMSPAGFARRAGRLRRQGPPKLLEHYTRIDEELVVLEKAIGEIATGWAERADREIDELRGG